MFRKRIEIFFVRYYGVAEASMPVFIQNGRLKGIRAKEFVRRGKDDMSSHYSGEVPFDMKKYRYLSPKARSRAKNKRDSPASEKDAYSRSSLYVSRLESCAQKKTEETVFKRKRRIFSFFEFFVCFAKTSHFNQDNPLTKNLKSGIIYGYQQSRVRRCTQVGEEAPLLRV